MGTKEITPLEQVDALFAVAKKHGYRVGSIQVYAEGQVVLEGLVPLAPDVEEEALVAARAKRDQNSERYDEDRRLLGIR